MSISVSSESATKTAIATIHGEESRPITSERVLTDDDHEPVSGVTTTNNRHMIAWQQVIHDDRNTNAPIAPCRKRWDQRMDRHRMGGIRR